MIVITDINYMECKGNYADVAMRIHPRESFYEQIINSSSKEIVFTSERITGMKFNQAYVNFRTGQPNSIQIANIGVAENIQKLLDIPINYIDDIRRVSRERKHELTKYKKATLIQRLRFLFKKRLNK